MKRINIPKAAYFITTNSDVRFPFFNNEVLFNLLEHTIEEVILNSDSILIGYKINPEHAHLIFRIGTKNSIFKVIQSLKRISSCRINQILCHYQEENHYETFIWTDLHKNLCKQFYKSSKIHGFPLFKWQKGFHDRLIRTPEQMYNCIQYLEKQQYKHSLLKNSGLKINKPVPNDILYINI